MQLMPTKVMQAGSLIRRPPLASVDAQWHSTVPPSIPEMAGITSFSGNSGKRKGPAGNSLREQGTKQGDPLPTIGRATPLT